MTGHAVVSREEWVGARRELLRKEKEWTRLRDELGVARRALPWVRVEKEYVFETPQGRVTLADLFAGRSQLVIYHFMMGPDWAWGCPSCSLIADGIDGATIHLAARDVTLMAVSRAPLAQIEPFRRRMGWRFPWASSFGSDFNFDYHVSFTPEQLASGAMDYNFERGGFPASEAPGASVFFKDEAGRVFHTYSSYARGLEPLVMTYHYLDLVPKGRDEDGLEFSMAWVRHHDNYGPEYVVGPGDQYAPPPVKPMSEGCPACAATTTIGVLS